ncbi:MAG: MFS transporter [Gammaproteobacteria bacterium]|nr:MAG: MFS transporter [Gammaproteobacteria bacterium]
MVSVVKDLPYWRLSGFYFFYFATLGIVVPYFGAFLSERGFTALEIGKLFAILNITKIIAPFIWGWISDTFGHRNRIIQLACLMAFLIFACITFTKSFAWMALITFGYSFFWNAALPQFEVVTLNYLQNDTNKYSQIRLWGSWGFIFTVIGIGFAVKYHPIGFLPYMGLAGYALIFANSLFITEKNGEDIGKSGNHTLKSTVFNKNVIVFFIVGLFLQASHGPFYAFFTIFLQENGHATDMIGELWAIGVVAEIVIFLLIHRMIPYFGARNLMLLALAAAVLRWWMTGAFASSMLMIALSQLLHAGTFGIFHAVAMKLIHSFFPGKYQGRGQALYTAICMGAGVALGNYFSGLLWNRIGGEGVFYLASGAAAVAFVITLLFLVNLPDDAKDDSEILIDEC